MPSASGTSVDERHENSIKFAVLQPSSVFASTPDHARTFTVFIRVIGVISFGMLDLTRTLGESVVSRTMAFEGFDQMLSYRFSAPRVQPGVTERRNLHVEFKLTWASRLIATFCGPLFHATLSRTYRALTNGGLVILESENKLYLRLRAGRFRLSHVAVATKRYRPFSLYEHTRMNILDNVGSTLTPEEEVKRGSDKLLAGQFDASFMTFRPTAVQKGSYKCWFANLLPSTTICPPTIRSIDGRRLEVFTTSPTAIVSVGRKTMSQVYTVRGTPNRHVYNMGFQYNGNPIELKVTLDHSEWNITLRN
ncbi:unnamed protein product, partial [Mesorhabditis spiculigera]